MNLDETITKCKEHLREYLENDPSLIVHDKEFNYLSKFGVITFSVEITEEASTNGDIFDLVTIFQEEQGPLFGVSDQDGVEEVVGVHQWSKSE